MLPIKGKKKNHTQCCEVEKEKAAHFSPINVNIMCVYISHFLSDILHLLAPFILDHVLNAAAGLAIKSSSMNYVFLPRRGLKRQQCWAGKLLVSGSCISFPTMCASVCVCQCVCERETGGSQPQRHSDCIRGLRTSEVRCDPLSSWSAVDRKTLHRAIKIFLHIHIFC